MPIATKCPGCGKSYVVKDEFAGKTAKCSQCGSRMQIPGPASSATPPSPMAAPPRYPPAAPVPPAPPTPRPSPAFAPPPPPSYPDASYGAPQAPYAGAPQAYPSAPPSYAAPQAGYPGAAPGYPGATPGYPPPPPGAGGPKALRIVAGVLIIVVGALDIGGFIEHSVEGDVKREAGGIGRDIEQGARDLFGVGSSELREESRKKEASGSLQMLFGFLLLGAGGVGIAAGVLLFLTKGALFVVIVGAIQALVDLVSLIAFGGGTTKLILNVVAIAVGAFVLFAGFTYLQTKKPTPAASRV